MCHILPVAEGLGKYIVTSVYLHFAEINLFFWNTNKNDLFYVFFTY